MSAFFLIPWLAGCSPVSATLSPPPWLDTEPTDTAPADPGDPDDTAVEDPVAEVWLGARYFDFGWCQEGVTEVGSDVGATPAFAGALEACSGCTQIFQLEVAPDALCNGMVPVESPALRGVAWVDHGADLYVISQTKNGAWSAALLASARQVGENGLEYGYRDVLWGSEYEVQGSVTIE